MPPKRRKKKSVKEPKPVPEKTLKETILERHLQDITKQLDKCKVRVAELQYENTSLEEEATKTRFESHEYMNYMGKKIDKRQKAVVSLSDYNKELFRSVKEEKKETEEKYDDQKKDLETILLAKRHVLHKIRKEMDDLQESKYLQEEQLSRIAQLEKEVMETRNHHASSVETLKDQYITEKMRFRVDADEKIRVLTKVANEEAKLHLAQYAKSVHIQNTSLRKQLQSLIEKNEALLGRRQHLQEQHKTLIWKLKYTEDLKSLQRKRIKKAHRLHKDDISTSEDLENTKNISFKKLFSEANL